MQSVIASTDLSHVLTSLVPLTARSPVG